MDKRYAVEGAPSISGSTVTTSLRTIPFAPGGKSTSTVTVRLCTSADCTTVYPGSTATFTVNLDVRLKDWATFQRDPGHTGYVAVAYKTADFTNAWSTPGGSSPAYRQVAARRGNIFLNLRNASGRLLTRGLNAATGATVWEYDLGQKNYFSGPTYANGRVISAAMDLSSGNIPMDVIDAEKGTYLRSLSYASQFATAGTPTPIGDDLFHAAGYFGNEVYGYDAAAGTRSWVQQSLGFPSQIGVVQEGESVAADANLVYYFSAGRLFTLSRLSGAVVNSISNPFFSSAGLSYFGTYQGGPILAGSGRVITFSDNRQSSQPQPLVAFSTTNNAVIWRTAASYVGDPALRDGKLYAIKANSAIVDIIDVTDGSVTASINLGADKGTLAGNVIATSSHLFVAGAAGTYAIDLQQSTYPIVWSAPQGGLLSITPDNLLIVGSVTGALNAYRLY